MGLMILKLQRNKYTAGHLPFMRDKQLKYGLEPEMATYQIHISMRKLVEIVSGKIGHKNNKGRKAVPS